MLAVPAAVWIAAAVAQVTGDCDVECGDRDRGYFLLVMVTAPLIPLGMALVAVGIGAFVDLVEGNYGVNLDDPAGSRRQAIIDVVIWVLGALWCFGVALGTLAVGRRLRRRYPSGPWHPGDRSTSAG